jgi:hypothetical protein
MSFETRALSGRLKRTERFFKHAGASFFCRNLRRAGTLFARLHAHESSLYASSK